MCWKGPGVYLINPAQSMFKATGISSQPIVTYLIEQLRRNRDAKRNPFLNLLEFYWMLSEPPPRVVLFWGCFWKKVPWVSIYEESRQESLRSAATCHVGFALSGAAQNNSFSKLKILSSRYCVLEEDNGLAASHLLKTKVKHLFWKKKKNLLTGQKY